MLHEKRFASKNRIGWSTEETKAKTGIDLLATDTTPNIRLGMTTTTQFPQP